MSEAPILCRWTGEAFVPANPAMLTRARAGYEVDEIYRIEFREDRSGPTHRHYFAILAEEFNNLPEDIASEFQSVDELRGFALIKSGYSDHVDVALGNEKLAQRIASFLAKLLARFRKQGHFKQYAVVVPRGTTVRIYTPQSQSYRAMDKQVFAASKEAVLGVISDLTGSDRQAISTRAAEAPDDAYGRNAPDIPSRSARSATERPAGEVSGQVATNSYNLPRATPKGRPADTPPSAVSGASPARAATPELPVTGGASPEGKSGSGGGGLQPKCYDEYKSWLPAWLGFTTSASRITARYAREQKELWPTFIPRLTEGQERYLDKMVSDAIKQVA